MKLTSLLRLDDKLQQTGKIDDLKQIWRFFTLCNACKLSLAFLCMVYIKRVLHSIEFFLRGHKVIDVTNCRINFLMIIIKIATLMLDQDTIITNNVRETPKSV